jgi:hypothetical protein
MYKIARGDSGCPPIYIFKIDSCHYCVESKDGLVFMEQVKVSNAWEAKWLGVQEWKKIKNKK